MSGGQQQRVAIARALAMNPAIVLADETTVNLDTASAESVTALMRTINRGQGSNLLIINHNFGLAKGCDGIVEVVDGRIARPTR